MGLERTQSRIVNAPAVPKVLVTRIVTMTKEYITAVYRPN